MPLRTQFRHDKQTSWLAVSDDIELECAHLDVRSAEYQQVLAKLTKPVRKIIEAGLLKPAQDREYAVRTFVAVCLKNWRTVKRDKEGKVTGYDEGVIPVDEGDNRQYSPENAIALFIELPQFYLDTLDLARDLGNFQLTDEERKNLGTA